MSSTESGPEGQLSNKERRWQELQQELSKVTDRLGKPIDAGIFDAVVAFSALLEGTGLKTRQSCEGHLDHGVPAPWIDFEPEPNSAVDIELKHLPDEWQRISDLIEQIEQENEDDDRLPGLFKELHAVRARMESLRAEQDMIIHQLLTEFYEDNLVNKSYDQILVLERSRRLQSIGANHQQAQDRDTKAANLNRYQEEMKKLAEFLKKKYLSS